MSGRIIRLIRARLDQSNDPKQARGVLTIHNPTPPVNCTYGAPLGRTSRPLSHDEAVKVSLRRVPINSGGYDRGGAYWGLGAPLYWAGADDGSYDEFFRAISRETAKAHVLQKLPNARFYR